MSYDTITGELVLDMSTTEAGADCDPICSIVYDRGDCQAKQLLPICETHDECIPYCNMLSLLGNKENVAALFCFI